MRLTLEQLENAIPLAGDRAKVFHPHLADAMEQYEINTANRMAAFLAQIAHESGSLRYVRELGSDKYLSKYDTGRIAERLGNTPEADGDGQKYRGRGLIQITGRDNYLRCSVAIFGNRELIHHPELLEEPKYACLSAAWFWQSRHLNELADKGLFRTITQRINGGLNGYEDRLEHYERARLALLSA